MYLIFSLALPINEVLFYNVYMILHKLKCVCMIAFHEAFLSWNVSRALQQCNILASSLLSIIDYQWCVYYEYYAEFEECYLLRSWAQRGTKIYVTY